MTLLSGTDSISSMVGGTFFDRQAVAKINLNAARLALFGTDPLPLFESNLDRPSDRVSGTAFARRLDRLSVVLDRDYVRPVLARMGGVEWLMARPLHGSGNATSSELGTVRPEGHDPGDL
jgi:hypothetical protein